MIRHKKGIFILLIFQLLVACTITILPKNLAPQQHSHSKRIHTTPPITPTPTPTPTPTHQPTPDPKYRWAPYNE